MLFVPIAYAQGVAAISNASQAGVSDAKTIILERLPLVAVACGILFVSFVLARFARRAAQRAIVRSGRHEGALSFVGKTVYIGCIILGLTISLKVAGVDISFVVGAVGFGLGFGLKGLLENYVAGVVILIQEPFRIGDMITVYDYFGRVEQIEARATFIRLFDGQRIIIPNADMVSQPLINFSTFPERRLTIEVGVSYDSDVSDVIRVALEALKKDNRILEEPAPMVTFNSIADSSFQFQIRYWIDNTLSNWLEMTSVGCTLITNAFREHNINMPFPVTTLSMNPLDSDDMYQLVARRHAVNENRQN